MDDTEVVTVRLSELLRHPEVVSVSRLVGFASLTGHPQDLDKISALKSEFARQKQHVDTELKTGLKSQLEVTEVLRFNPMSGSDILIGKDD
jgi:hypothetical protein